MSKYDDIIKLAAADIGYTESPANSNKQKYGKWYGYDGAAWCMMAVQYWHNLVGCKLPYKTASCSGLLNWYKANRPECVKSVPKKGYIVIYNFGHTGLVESVSNGTITAIEGNTSATDKGSQDNGGGVFRRTRKTSLVTAYIDGINIKDEPKPKKEEPKPTPKPIVKDDDYMTKAEILKELGDQYIERFDQLPKWAKADMRQLLDEGIINGGTDASVDPDDINMFLSDIKSILAIKRLVDKK